MLTSPLPLPSLDEKGFDVRLTANHKNSSKTEKMDPNNDKYYGISMLTSKSLGMYSCRVHSISKSNWTMSNLFSKKSMLTFKIKTPYSQQMQKLLQELHKHLDASFKQCDGEDHIRNSLHMQVTSLKLPIINCWFP